MRGAGCPFFSAGLLLACVAPVSATTDELLELPNQTPAARGSSMGDETGGAPAAASTLLPSPPTRQYLEQAVYPALFRALCAADRARPTDVAGFLAQQLRAPPKPDAPAPEPEEDQDAASAREPVAVSEGGDVVSLFSFYDTKGTSSLAP